jgi:hypothetical protein
VELRFSEHAAERMRERAIDAAEVAEVLSDPEDRHPSADEPNRTVVIGRPQPAVSSSSSSSAAIPCSS